MILVFTIDKQIITRRDNEKVVRDSVNYLHVNFSFSEEWTGDKTAVFKSKSGIAYNVLVGSDGSCLVPWEVLKEEYFEVSAFCGDLITANVVKVFTIPSGYEIGSQGRIPTPDIYTQIIARLSAIEAEIDPTAIQQVVEEYLSDKDYVTEQDVEQIVANYVEAHKDELKGEKGDTGATGPQGPQGEQGPKGDTGEGVAAGGTTGQVLIKSSNADYETEWGTVEGVEYSNQKVVDVDLSGLTPTTDKWLHYRGSERDNPDDFATNLYTLPIVGGHKYSVEAYQYSSTAICAFYDANDTFISAIPSSSQSLGVHWMRTGEIIAPSNATTMKVCSMTNVSNPVVVVKEIFDTNVSYVGFDSIDGIKKAHGYRLLENLEKVNNYVVKGSGDFLNNVNYWGAEIPVNEGEKYKIFGKAYTQSALYGLYDSNGDVVTTYPSSGDGVFFETVYVTIPSNVKTLKVSSYNAPLEVYKYIENLLFIDNEPNVLYGKKWCACGDSFTAGDFADYVDSKGNTQKMSDAWDDATHMWKTYPWWIANRNKMTIELLALSGSDFTNISGARSPFSAITSAYNYTLINPDCDYITLAYGLNESDLTAEQIGTKTDSDNTTLWGAYNVVLEAILTANPKVKIGIIVSDSWLSQTYHDALIEIAEYWGIPYLDLRDGKEVPMMINGRLSECSTVAKTLRNGAFETASTQHPTPEGHKYRSTVIENFLRSL